MGSLTSWTTAEQLLKSVKLCDIVEFNRVTYSHFGFYIGDGICVHVQAPNSSSLGSSCRSSSNTMKTDSGTKVVERLLKIAGGDFVRVNNSEVTAFQLGVNRRPVNEAKQLALKDLPVDDHGNVVLGRSIHVTYFLVSANNCEGWSTYWRYNHPYGWSMQANNGFVHSTVGMVERVSDVVLCTAELILNDDHSSIAKKTTAATVMVPYVAVKYSATCVKKASDFVVGSVMKIFNSDRK